MLKKIFSLALVCIMISGVFAFAQTENEDLAERLEHAHFMVRKLSYLFSRYRTPEKYWRLIYWRGECAKLMKEAGSGI